MQIIQSRRRFLAGLSAAGAASLVGVRASLAAEPPLETTSVRLAKIRGICIAPQYVAEELLHPEGFTDVSYVVTEAAVGAVGGDRERPGGLHFEFCRVHWS